MLMIHTHRHIVIGVRHENKFGSLGFSRKEELYFKPLVHDVRCFQAVCMQIDR